MQNNKTLIIKMMKILADLKSEEEVLQDLQQSIDIYLKDKNKNNKSSLMMNISISGFKLDNASLQEVSDKLDKMSFEEELENIKKDLERKGNNSQ